MDFEVQRKAKLLWRKSLWNRLEVSVRNTRWFANRAWQNEIL